MFSKKFYDVLTIVFVILAILSIVFGSYFNLFSVGEDRLPNFQSSVKRLLLQHFIISISGFIYYIFILVLAIQLYSKKQLSLLDTIITAVIIPLAPIYYLFTLRKALKNFEGVAQEIPSQISSKESLE